MAPRRPISDLDLISVFQLLTPTSQLQAALMSPRCCGLVRAANLKRSSRHLKRLIITSWDRLRDTRAAVGQLSLASKPSLRALQNSPFLNLGFTKDDDDDFPRSDLITKWNTLKLEIYEVVDERFIKTMVFAFPAVTELHFLSNTNNRLLVGLLRRPEWACQLRCLLVQYYSRGQGKEAEEKAVVTPFFEAINNGLPALRRLALNWDSDQVVLPELPVLSRLQVMAISLPDSFEYRKGFSEEEHVQPQWQRLTIEEVILKNALRTRPDMNHFVHSLERFAAVDNAALQVHLFDKQLPNNFLDPLPFRNHIVHFGVVKAQRPLLPSSASSRLVSNYYRQRVEPAVAAKFTSLRSLSLLGVFDVCPTQTVVVPGDGSVTTSLQTLFTALLPLQQLVRLELKVHLSGLKGEDWEEQQRMAAALAEGGNRVYLIKRRRLIPPMAPAQQQQPRPFPVPPIFPSVRALDLHLELSARSGQAHERVAELGRQLRWALPAVEALHLQDYHCMGCRVTQKDLFIRSCLSNSRSSGETNDPTNDQQVKQCLQATLPALYPDLQPRHQLFCTYEDEADEDKEKVVTFDQLDLQWDF